LDSASSIQPVRVKRQALFFAGLERRGPEKMAAANDNRRRGFFYTATGPVRERDPSAKLVVADIHADPKRALVIAIAIKRAVLAGKGRTRRGRPPDVAFAEALLIELEKRRIRLGLNKACLRAAAEVAERLEKKRKPAGARKTLKHDSVRTRVADLLACGQQRRP
jgi:hypothetical protein